MISDGFVLALSHEMGIAVAEACVFFFAIFGLNYIFASFCIARFLKGFKTEFNRAFME